MQWLTCPHARACACVCVCALSFCAGAYQCWGYDNREVPLRVCCPRGGPQSTNAEYKSFDGTTNPYIGLAALLAAGMQGGQCYHCSDCQHMRHVWDTVSL